MVRYGRHSRSALLAAALAALAGCQARNQITLKQTFAPPAQRAMALSSEWAFSRVEGGRREYLFAFPLPRAVAGARDFLVYLSTPERDGDLQVAPSSPDGVRGFFVQVVGQLAGKTVLTSGVVRVKQPLLAGDRRRIELDVTCEDSTHIVGVALAAPAAHELSAFMRRYAADVFQLDPQHAAQATHPAPTETGRRTGAPGTE